MSSSKKIVTDLGQLIGNGIRIIPRPESSFAQVQLPTQTPVAKEFFQAMDSHIIALSDVAQYQYQVPKTSAVGYVISFDNRPNLEIFGEFLTLDEVTDGTIESRMFRKSTLTPNNANNLYTSILQLQKLAINKFAEVQQNQLLLINEIELPNFINIKAIDDLNDRLNILFEGIEKSDEIEQGQTWEKSKTAIRGFVAKIRTKAVEKTNKKDLTIPKSDLEIIKHLKWIVAGSDNKSITLAAKIIKSYVQDVLIPYKLGKELVFDNTTLNTNFFSIGQVWSRQDGDKVIYTPLTVNNLDTGYLPHSLEIRYLLDALKNVGPRLINIQSTYNLLFSSIKDYIHEQAELEQGQDYNLPKTENQIRVTLNTLLAGFYNDVVNDFKEPGATEMTEKEEILDWVLSLLVD